jgi:hypothetical protein
MRSIGEKIRSQSSVVDARSCDVDTFPVRAFFHTISVVHMVTNDSHSSVRQFHQGQYKHTCVWSDFHRGAGERDLQRVRCHGCVFSVFSRGRATCRKMLLLCS